MKLVNGLNKHWKPIQLIQSSKKKKKAQSMEGLSSMP